MIVSAPFETKKVQRDGTFEWGVTLYQPGLSSKTKRFRTREEAQAFHERAIRTKCRANCEES